jgi:glycosyltransferase involved in cell wall biosynthesis
MKKVFSRIRPYYDDAFLFMYKNRKNVNFSIAKAGISIINNTNIKAADIIHLHWFNRGYLSLFRLKELSNLNKPIIWTLHDMWAFTGGCHYSNGCDRYKNQCGFCPVLNSNREKDISRKTWKRKVETFMNMNMSIVTCSKWLGKCAESSSLLKMKTVFVIPNTLDTHIFKPIEKNVARNILNLPQDKKFVLFGATSAASEERKGFKYLIESLNLLYQNNVELSKKIEVLVFGASSSNEIEKLPYRIHFLGNLYDEYSLTLCYNAADVFIAPSLEDNLPNTVMEAISCGTPVIAFAVGGIPDMIEHNRNGYLAKPYEPEDLAKGITTLLLNDHILAKMSTNARNKVLYEFNMNKIACSYLDLYKSTLDKSCNFVQKELI